MKDLKIQDGQEDQKKEKEKEFMLEKIFLKEYAVLLQQNGCKLCCSNIFWESASVKQRQKNTENL